MTSYLNTISDIRLRLRLHLNLVCGQPRESLRSLALGMVSHRTLLRGPGPLGAWSVDPKVTAAKLNQSDSERQAAIIKSGIALGFVFYNGSGYEVRS